MKDKKAATLNQISIEYQELADLELESIAGGKGSKKSSGSTTSVNTTGSINIGGGSPSSTSSSSSSSGSSSGKPAFNTGSINVGSSFSRFR